MTESREQKLNRRLQELTERERRCQAQGMLHVAGIDEAGRGPLAGPVVAACVVFAPGEWVLGVDDSKRLSANARERLAGEIRRAALAVGVGEADVEDIARVNILEATRLASLRALEDLGMEPDFLYTDSLELPTPIAHEAIVGADRLVYCVAAASIIAKTHRDRIMVDLDAEYPGYGLARNKGYGTREHREALARLGPTPIHRARFLRKILSAGTDE